MRLPDLVITMRTADRSTGDTKGGIPSGRTNYLGRTLRQLQTQGVDLTRLYLYSSDPDRRWIEESLGDLPRPQVSAPVKQRRTPNENALAQVQALDRVSAEWILMLEDDVEACADFVGSVRRWIATHAHPDYHVYRLFSFRQPTSSGAETYRFTLREMVGSQAVLLRAEDARDLCQWHAEHRHSWRPTHAPFHKDFQRGFDKMIGYWALARWPKVKDAIVTRPFFVRHIGAQSSLRVNTWGLQNNHFFAGTQWAYRPATTEVA